uniref:hypothetical protein n=1 Tax=Escherichia coli TaxID=562 RepID=UPI001F1E9E2D|nr:hypothetical protein [Escherichia coli]
MSELAEKPLITRVAPPERIYYCASRAEGLKPDRHEIRMQSQFFCCLASSGYHLHSLWQNWNAC